MYGDRINDVDLQACNGAMTRESDCYGSHMVECIACQSAVRWDLEDHPFFGWQNCPRKIKAAVQQAVEGAG